MPAVHDQLDLAGHDVWLIRADVQRANGCPRRLAKLFGELADRQHHRRRRDQRVRAQAQRGRAGVVGPSLHPDPGPIQPADRFNHAERDPFGVEDRPLLDVQLEKDRNVGTFGLANPDRVQPILAHRVGHHHAIGVA